MPSQEEKASEAAQTSEANFENLLDSIGPFGIYQKILCFLLIGGSTFICSLTYYTQIILMLSPPATCRGIPVTSQSEDGCRILGGPISNDSVGSDFFDNASDVQHNFVRGDHDEERACQNWTYDTNVLFNTIASENDWVCDEVWRPAMVHGLFWAGNIIGSWVWGFISDKLGRRPATLASFTVYAVGGALTLIRPDKMAAVLAFRFLVGSSHHTVTHLPYVLAMEYCGGAHRTYPLLILIGAWALGGALLPWLARAVWSWRPLVVLASAPLLLAVVLYRYVPESASWLLVRGRGDEAAVLLRRVAAINGRELDEALFCEVAVDKKEQDSQVPAGQGLGNVLKYPRLMKNMALVTLLWMIACLCFYGHSQNTGNIGGDMLISFSLGGSVELVALAVPFLLKLVGRKKPMVFFFVTSGACGVLYAVIGPMISITARLVLALTGRLLIMGAYSTCLQYGPELFPTVIRGQSLALYETLGGIAIFVSPSIVFLHHQHPGLPLLIIGALSLAGGVLTLFLPETAGAHLPQTLADGNQLGAGQTALSGCCAGRQNKVLVTAVTPITA